MVNDIATTMSAAPPRSGRRTGLALLVVLMLGATVGVGLWWRHAAAATATAARERGANALPVSAVPRCSATCACVCKRSAASLPPTPRSYGHRSAAHWSRCTSRKGSRCAPANCWRRSMRAASAPRWHRPKVLARDAAQLENARLDLERYRGLVQQDAAPKQQADTQAALVRQLEGTVQSDRAAVDSARLQLTWTHVVAPIAGRAGLKQADLGNVVSPTDTTGIVTITQTRPIALVFAVPAQHLPAIHAQLRAHAALPVEPDRAGQHRLAVGEVQTADNAIDATTDTIRVKALFPNADDALFPNQAVNVMLQLDTQVGAVTVPQAALQRGAQGAFVYVVRPMARWRCDRCKPVRSTRATLPCKAACRRAIVWSPTAPTGCATARPSRWSTRRAAAPASAARHGHRR